MKRLPAGGKRTLPRRVRRPTAVPSLPPAVIGGIEGGHVCERCGKTVPTDQMTAGGKNCRECGHPNHHRELANKRQQRATVRSQLLKTARLQRREVARLEELCDKATDLHGGTEELAKQIHGDCVRRHEEQPGSLTGVRQLEEILWLVSASAESEMARRKALGAMSDEELDGLVRELAGEVLAEFT